jgi:SAM-dependent methyltransferase
MPVDVMASELLFHQISEAGHRILNPLSDEKLRLLGSICCDDAHPVSHLDLACGKGEMLCRWANTYGNHGVGIDLNPAFIEDARSRATDLRVEELVDFREGDAAQPDLRERRFEIVSCIGATWIGGGLTGTIQLMNRFLHPDGLLLIGEPFWNDVPAGEPDLLGDPEDFATLAGTASRFEETGTELVEMVLADHDDWDRYQASQWRSVVRWLDANPNHPDVPTFRETHRSWRDAYLAYGRRRWGWGVFVLRSVG